MQTLVLQEDMRKVAVERKGETNFFTAAHIKDCMKKVIAVTLHQTVQVIPVTRHCFCSTAVTCLI